MKISYLVILSVVLSISLYPSYAQEETKSHVILNFDFINPSQKDIQKYVDYSITLSQNEIKLFESSKITHSSSGKVSIPLILTEGENYDVLIKIHGIHLNKIPTEKASFNISTPSVNIQRQLTDKQTVLISLAIDKNPFNQNKEIPDWFKTHASWWGRGSIDDNTFVQGMEYLIKEKIIDIPKLPYPSSLTEDKIPPWVKQKAVWWADDLIEEEEFIKGIKYLVEKGIIEV